MATKASERIRLGEKLGYGVGDLASGLILNFFGFFLLYYFVDLGGLAPAAIGLMLLITKLIDAVTDPMMGAIADRTRTRWGRYRPYLLFGPIPLALSIVLIFNAPDDLGDTALLVWAYVTYTIAMLAFTSVNVPYGGLLGVISPSSSERSNVTAFRMFFSALGGILVGALGTTLVRELGGGDEKLGILLAMSCIAAVSVFALLTTFATTKERIPPAETNGAIWSDVGILVRTGPWIAIAVAAILGVTAIAARAGTAPFFFKYVVGDDGTPVFLFFDRPALFLTALALGQVAGVLIGFTAQKRFEKSHLIITAGLLKAGMITVFYFLPLDAVWSQAAVQFLVGIGFGMLMVLSFSMFTDIAEYIDWKSGRQMTALVVAASVFGVKAGIGFGSAIPGFILQFTGFDPNGTQSETALLGIQLAFAIIPAAVMIPAAIAMLFYGINRQVIAKVESDLSARRTTAV
ncbi:glycoside-pentoside-hexuronide (GPH):cation symporter [Erythrobacter sp. F6033]|uniref:MFS transporter n=1 Tax=Erythrobacter sp. F6033 TaxID=2926401 RepID=UPI001FF42D96|nr:glycoside-pentoside-hexuronide (GPH):cation symporter [Erythrobacter sp. F6033]MCK0127950.1 glycoside-pentoside-hexuronide (GPH):cation symporter [Erythrobacter sp. F6033]